MLTKKRNIHFVGVGGIGMSAIARVLLEMGHNVSGSDIAANGITKNLESIGGAIFTGHRPANLPRNTDILVYSSSISGTNAEMAEAARRNVQVVHRARMLGEIFNRKKGIAIAGMHGKTTTSSLVAVMLKNTGMDPTAVVGGEVKAFGGNARLGKGDLVVAEADESDGSFLHLRPFYAVITNIEPEHLDHFKTLGRIRSSFRSFVGNLKRGGKVFYNASDPNIRKVLSGFRGRRESFGFSPKADMRATGIRMDGFMTSFTCVRRGRELGTVELSIPGRHNVLNAMAAILVGLDLGIPFNEITAAIRDFDGARRRFQLRADADGVMLIDDYAHHPTEIRAVLNACRNWKKKRIVAIFQPHRYSRTKFFADAFGKCFKGVDKLILTDIYAASEEAIEGVSVKTIYDRAKKNGVKDAVIMKKDAIPDHVMKVKRPGDMILVLGAGDIKGVADRLASMIGAPAGSDTVSRVPYSSDRRLINDLKHEVKGVVRTDEDLRRRTSLKIGGPADIWIEPADAPNLKKAIAFARSRAIPFFVIGNGSNLLASDRGFSGMLIHLGSDSFKRLKVTGAKVRVGGGYSLPRLVNFCCKSGLAGLESLAGIPGTVGGAIYMNAGGYASPVYRNIGSMVESLKVMDSEGSVKTLKGKEIKFGYRSSDLGSSIVLEAVLKLGKGDSASLTQSLLRFLKMKKEKHVLDMPNAGCVFKNPKDSHFTCGQMIDMLKLKGTRIGGAEISGKHANFIVNRGGATHKDVIELVGFIRKKVKENYNIDLELEVKVI